jgi:hypothetical protein
MCTSASLEECLTKIKECNANFRFFSTGGFIEKRRVFFQIGESTKTGLKTD